MARDPIHPGRFLADEVDALGMSVPQVAKVLHVPANRIYQLLKGQRALTADTALRLSQWLGTSAEMWLNLQKLYELRLAEQEVGKKIKSTIVRRQPAQAASRVLADFGTQCFLTLTAKNASRMGCPAFFDRTVNQHKPSASEERAVGPTAGGQCRKCRIPVKTMAMPSLSAAAITSSSRTEPPG